ncbi:hypothetical protein [Flavobacterium sp.]|uniref:hypothetical protein n=1 Tax=Flavobacterium sp. TaxID=239 RepID=UPI004033AF9E
MLFSLTGCDEEAFEFNRNNEETITRKISLEELKKRPKAYQKLLQYMEKAGAGDSRKNVYNSKYEFAVDTSEIIYVDKGELSFLYICDIPG